MQPADADENLVLRHLRAIDEKLDRFQENAITRLTGIEARMRGIEERFHAMETRLGGIEVRLDRVEQRWERLEHRAGLIDYEQPHA